MIWGFNYPTLPHILGMITIRYEHPYYPGTKDIAHNWFCLGSHCNAGWFHDVQCVAELDEVNSHRRLWKIVNTRGFLMFPVDIAQQINPLMWTIPQPQSCRWTLSTLQCATWLKGRDLAVNRPWTWRNWPGFRWKCWMYRAWHSRFHGKDDDDDDDDDDDGDDDD